MEFVSKSGGLRIDRMDERFNFGEEIGIIFFM